MADADGGELAEIEVSPVGFGLHWPKLDVDYSVPGLVAGVFGTARWMAARAGRASSPAKAAAARANGAKGGRPRKTSSQVVKSRLVPRIRNQGLEAATPIRNVLLITRAFAYLSSGRSRLAIRNIGSISDFLAARAEDSAAQPGVTWYRGHSDSAWTLTPGYMRSQSTVSESTLMTRFKQSAAMLTERFPKDDFDWLFLMQHYGVPTRLLDWSESPLVALYFAVESGTVEGGADAALWCLQPTILNRNANIISNSEEAYIPSFDDDELQGYAPNSVRQSARLELFPVATIATRNNARIQAQMGTFTIHHNAKIPIEEVGDRSHVVKYIIPNASKDRMLSEVRDLGISRFSMFPELASVGRILSELMA